ncbi:MAG: glycerol-3-phosphate acyltransferase, partial [Planctomycetes bacterium]|nr:glycerol-3-phosphate acyltransferase [Planctomycetota bacterium]
MNFGILIAIAYLLGSIPFGLIIAKAHGRDLRSIGSGNIGATNLARALGKKWACFCFALDAAKGLAPMLAAAKLIDSAPTTIELFLWLAVGSAAVLGHIFPIYIRFKGGKGVATSFGVALGLWPYYTICAAAAFLIWVVVVLLWRY